MTVATPCDYHQTKKMIHASVGWKHPIYIRFFRDNTPVFTDPAAAFAFGKADTLIDGKDVTVIACGLQVWEAVLAEEVLSKEGISVRLLNMHTLKPIDREAIVKAARETGALVTAEDHQKHAGLAGAVAEILAWHQPAPMESVAVNDTFGESGRGDELMKKYGVARDDIVKAVRTVLKRKH
jgi:transketolase